MVCKVGVPGWLRLGWLVKSTHMRNQTTTNNKHRHINRNTNNNDNDNNNNDNDNDNNNNNDANTNNSLCLLVLQLFNYTLEGTKGVPRNGDREEQLIISSQRIQSSGVNT